VQGDLNLQVDVWFPLLQERAIKDVLAKSGLEQGGPFSPDSAGVDKGMLPTFVRVNVLVTTYGAPGYQEANPALFITSRLTDPTQDGVVPFTDDASQHARRIARPPWLLSGLQG